MFWNIISYILDHILSTVKEKLYLIKKKIKKWPTYQLTDSEIDG